MTLFKSLSMYVSLRSNRPIGVRILEPTVSLVTLVWNTYLTPSSSSSSVICSKSFLYGSNLVTLTRSAFRMVVKNASTPVLANAPLTGTR